MSYAARFSDTIGKWSLSLWKSMSRLKRSPGCPAMSVRGFAHRAFRGQRFLGSIRGRRFAGCKRK